jgi:hypothetical protein
LSRSPDQVVDLLRQRGRVTYCTLKRQFQLDDETLEDLKMNASRGNEWPWTKTERYACGAPTTAPPDPSAPTASLQLPPLAYTPLSRGEHPPRPQCPGRQAQADDGTLCRPEGVLEVPADSDPEEAQQLLDPGPEWMMAALHCYEGTANQVRGANSVNSTATCASNARVKETG